MAIAYLGLGSNLGDRIGQLLLVQTLLQERGEVSELKPSSFYLSSPVGYQAQPDFINQVLSLHYAGTVDDLFSLTRSIELAGGRSRDPVNQNAPRRLDIDILLFDNVQHLSANLEVPHPRMLQRRFVLEPLLEIAPGLRLPNGELLVDIYDKKKAAGDFQEQTLARLAET